MKRKAIMTKLYLRCVGTVVAALAVAAAFDAFAQTAQGRPPDLAPLIEQIDEASDDITEENDPDGEFQALLSRARQRLEAAQRFELEAQDYAAAVEDAPRIVGTLERQNPETNLEPIPDSAVDYPLGNLRALLARKELRLVTVRQRASELADAIDTEKNFDIQARLREIASLPTPENPPPDASSVARRVQNLFVEATRAVRNSETTLLEQRQVGRDARLSILQAELDAENEKIELLDDQIGQLSLWISDHRQSEAERLASAARGALARQTAAPDLVTLANQNIDMSSALIELIGLHQRVSSDYEALGLENQRITQRYESLERQLESTDLSSTPEFGAALRQYRDQLIDFESARNQINRQQDRLTEARLAQFQLESAEVIDSSRETSLDATTETQLREDHKRLRALLQDAYASYIDDLTISIAQQEELLANSRRYGELIDKHLLWMPSSRPISVKTLSGVPDALAWTAAPDNWRQLKPAGPLQMLFAFIALLAGIAVLRARPRITQYFVSVSKYVGKVQHDSIRYSVSVLALTLLLALAIPLFLLAGSFAVDDSGTFAAGVIRSLLIGALVFYVISVLHNSVLPNGLGEKHFRWHDSTLQVLRRHLPWFSYAFTVVVMFNVLIDSSGRPEFRDSLGRMTFIVGTLILAVFAYRVLAATRKSIVSSLSSLDNSQRWSLRYLMLPLIVVLPVLVAILSALGYHYTAIQLDTMLIYSGVLLLAANYVFYLSLRWLSISERRYSLKALKEQRERQRAQNQEREAASASGDAVPEHIDTEHIDLQTISEQTKALVKMIVFVVTAVCLWSIWSALFSSFQALETVELYTTAELIDNVSTAVPVTLWDLILALAIALVTYIGAKNIPGLLEVGVLSRLSLQQGTSYAVTTICRYVIVIAGTITVLQMLGAQWSKVQWLVAALSVGLGFGLQEIVANFVSGIVLLFERPIRIGDTVTVGDQMGTVSKIRIRATTILDWDNKEVIIPNKNFITERLVNWTLSDATTRKTIKVGVAYGSDVNKTEKLLLEVARDCDGVLAEPAPAALFLGFGSSSLDFELRVFIRSIREILPVTHRLHKAIDQVFRDNDIEIAFPQQDIHFDDTPFEIRLVDGAKPDGDSGQP